MRAKMQTVFDLRKLKRQFEKGVHKMKGWTKLWHHFAKAKMGMKIRIAFLAMMLIGMTGWWLVAQSAKPINPQIQLRIPKKKSAQIIRHPLYPPTFLKDFITFEMAIQGYTILLRNQHCRPYNKEPKYFRRQLYIIQALESRMRDWNKKILALGIITNQATAKQKFNALEPFFQKGIEKIVKNQRKKRLYFRNYVKQKQNLKVKYLYIKNYVDALKKYIKSNS